MEKLLTKIIQSQASTLFKVGLVGLERETLRVNKDGVIAGTPHPSAVGAALTHPHITTDYSEALLEFVTPPLSDTERALSYLRNLQTYVSTRIGDEYLWPASMPCRLRGEDSIRIAEYGSSNLGMMKHVYRRGLGHRYGKTMQVIAGIHVNLSIDESFWCIWQDILSNTQSRQDFISQQYFILIRNLQRVGWLIPYLFGASPAIDRSFNHVGVSQLQQFDANTLYQPFATSLRLGDIGYTNHRENEIGVKACYDNLPAYIRCLTRAIETPCPEYQKIGVKVDGEYRQLNANLLQIENEYYSTVRPKQPGYLNEKPTMALHRRGVRYVELRSLDLNPFTMLGLESEQLKFIEMLFLYCLIADSSAIDNEERRSIDSNESTVAHRGREANLQLIHKGRQRSLMDWGLEVLASIQEIVSVVKDEKQRPEYQAIINQQLEKLHDPQLTPSARVLAEMKSGRISYFELIEELAKQHQRSSKALQLDQRTLQDFDAIREESLQQQCALENVQEKSFDIFLQEYFKQKLEE